MDGGGAIGWGVRARAKNPALQTCSLLLTTSPRLPPLPLFPQTTTSKQAPLFEVSVGLGKRRHQFAHLGRDWRITVRRAGGGLQPGVEYVYIEIREIISQSGQSLNPSLPRPPCFLLPTD